MNRKVILSFLLTIFCIKGIAQTLGIGAAQFVPSAMLEVRSTGNTNTSFAFKLLNSSSAPLIYVDNGGNVGIGTTTADQKLHIYSGNFKMPVTTAAGADGVVYAGNNSFIHNYNSGVFVGINAGNFTMTGSHIIAIGTATGRSVSSGTQNTFVGDSAGNANTTASLNAFIGQSAGIKTTSGGNNTYIGDHAGYNNTNGQYNASLGANTGGNGIYNTFVGFAAGTSNTYRFNTFIGDSAGALNTSGASNLCMGYNAGHWANGSYNTYIGSQAGTGNGNINVSYLNIIIGNTAGSLLGGYDNIFVGTSGDRTSDGGGNVFFGYGSGVTNETGNLNTLIGFGADVGAANLTVATAIGNGAIVNVSNTMVFGNSNVVGWGFAVTPNAANAIEVGTAGTIGNGAACTIGGVWVNGSSRNFKEDFHNLNSTEVLSKMRDLNVTRWKYKNTNEYHIGPVAEDFYEAFKTGNDNKHISTIDPSAVVLIAIQELLNRAELLIKENESLEKEIAELKKSDKNGLK